MSDQNHRVPVAFLSYARFNNQLDEDRISDFCKRLAGEVEAVTGEPFEIFQDLRNIRVGQQWKERVEQALGSTTLLIAILSPSFFKSEYCRKEIEQFLNREARLGRNDLIIPVNYIGMDRLKNPERDPDDFFETMKSRQAFDWTKLRFAERDSSNLSVAINELALQIKDALGRFVTVPDIRKAPAQAPRADIDLITEPVTQTDHAKVTQPQIRVVDFLRGPYFTLAKAVSDADPGDRILVRPGTYEQGLVLDKPLEIINEGKTEEVIVQAHGANALAFRTTLGRIVNITLRQLGGGDYFAVDIVQGRLNIEGCHIESVSLAGISVHGTEADPVIRNNRIRGCLKSGVVMFDHARGTLEENDIAENNGFGVVIRDGANPVLRSNNIHNNEQGGVMTDGSLGRIEDNAISGNNGEGVVVANGANPVLQRNKIFRNTRAGIYVYDRGSSTVRENKIFDNHNSGIAIRTEGNPIIQENSISGNNGKGVWCNDRAAGVVENNDLGNNNFGAFWKSDDCTTRYVGNKE
jgi:parallel beta-helix repeat protein